MFEPSVDVTLSNQRDGLRQSVGEFPLGPSLERTKCFLELGHTALNWIEVWGVSRDRQNPGSGSFNQLNGPGRVVKFDVVEQDDGARAQAGDEQVLDIQLKDLRVDCPFNRHRRADSVHPQRADYREVASVMEGFGDVRPLAKRGAGVSARHRQVDAEFVKEAQVFPLQRRLLLLERGALFGVGLGGELGLFFRDSPSACRPRQRVLRLTAPRAFFFSCSRSSSSVASGRAVTNSGNCRSWSSESFAWAPPPCGKGAISPRSRFWRSRLQMKDSCTPNN